MSEFIPAGYDPLLLWWKLLSGRCDSGAGSVVLSVPCLVAIGIYVRLGKSVMYFPWSSRIWLNGRFICVPEQNMRCCVPVSVILKEKAARE